MRLFLSIALACIVCLSASSVAAQEWQTEPLIPSDTFYLPSIAVADNHVLHMAAASTYNGKLYYFSRLGGSWSDEVIVPRNGGTAGDRALRFGPDGRARILSAAYVYSQTGSGWTISSPRLGWSETSEAMVIDVQGVSRFCSTSYVSYTGRSSVNSDFQEIGWANSFPTGSACAMELMSDGTPNIVALPASTAPLVLYSDPGNDGTWNQETIGPGLYPAMAIDGSDQVHICYSRNDQLMYAVRLGPDDWVGGNITEPGHGLYPSMALASNGRVCISYFDPDGSALRFASKGRDETTWHYSTVQEGVKGGSSIALDGSSIHIGYTDANDGLHSATAALATGAGSLPTLAGTRIRAVPNPFNPATMIEYVVPARARVRVAVYDAAGHMTENLVDDVRDAGSYRVRYSPRAASGVYFARVDVAGKSATAKIVLLK